MSLTWLILYQCVTHMAHFVPLSLTWLILYQCVTDMARTLRFYLIITIMNLYEFLSNIDSPRDDCLSIYMYIITFVHYFVVLFSFVHLHFLCLAVILTIRVAHSLVFRAGAFSEPCYTVYCVCVQSWCIF